MEKRIDDFKELVRRSRSCRRFIEEPISREVLLELVDLARLSASAANLQPLKYILSYEKEMNERIFPNLKWAAYLKEWEGPEEGERPSAYIIVLGDREVSSSFGCDHGIASQNIVLGANNMGYGCCMIATVDKAMIKKALEISDRYEILHVIAIGKPGEEIRIEAVGEEGTVRYWRDDEGVHHVPKRTLEDIVI